MFNSIKAQSRLAIALFLVSLLTVSIGGLIAGTRIANITDFINDGIMSGSQEMAPLMQATNDIRYDVAQVQQWLTDISATRGLDGLDDGFSEAQAFADAFKSDIAKAKSHAQTLDFASVFSALEHVEAAFDPYYETGKLMAQAYVDQGPAGGNALMSSFDNKAADINDAVEKLMDKVRLAIAERNENLTSASAAVTETTSMSLIVTVVFLVIGVIVALIIARKLSKAANDLGNTSKVMSEAKAGHLNTRVLNITRKDEVGQLQRDLNGLLDYTESFVREAGASMEYVARGEYFRPILENGMHGSFLTTTRTMNSAVDAIAEKVGSFKGVASTFETTMNESVEIVSSTTTVLGRVADTMNELSEKNSERAGQIDAALERGSNNVQAVAGASTELSASISEISRQSSESSVAADNAVTDVESASQRVQTLAEAATKIGEVVALITDIADQTNLLALNATIEAARAGEAGKGFAVVASEVKNLANQTAKATEEISSQIGGIQGATEEAVEAISGIGSVVRTISTNASAIAAAVEEQGAATSEIARNVDNVATDTQSIADLVKEMSGATKGTGMAANMVLDASENVGHLQTELKKGVDTFFIEMKKVV